ncbi:unnamed protein product [Mytilus coruscus]|uniref:Mutator-like transposase domain-containing protein n=1 Tax=Mytilus coruscus TaxID=42192 RepID=A0A6J8C5V0_MYTCO|nr:unnamed protein product [Mytilus coruscus]
MPGRTKKDREKLLNNFALDLAERCQSEFTQAMEIYGGDFVKVKNKISFTVDAIPACYTGNHELCRRHSFVCKGGKKFWLYNRAFLPNSFKIRKLDENLNAIRKSEDSSNRTVNVRLNAIMWNSVFREHQRLHPNCNGFLQWNMEREEKFGFVNREEAMCDKCTYRSRKFKLYEEVQTKKPGRKAAKINVSAQAALSQTPLGYTGLRKIVLGCNMPAPSTSGLQKRANKVLPEIVNIDKKDMKARRKQLIAINTLRGRKDPGSVSLQADGAYNNAIYSGIGKTPFQPATQVVYSVAEAETEDKKAL